MPYTPSLAPPDSGLPICKEDINFSAPNAYRFVIDGQTFQHVEYTVQTVSLPGISIDGAEMATPYANLGLVGDKIVYEDLSLTFIVDEFMVNYRQIHDWILRLTLEDEKDDDKYYDCTLLILTSHNNVAKEIKFINAYPTSLSSLEFDSRASDVDYLTATVNLKYSYYKFV